MARKLLLTFAAFFVAFSLGLSVLVTICAVLLVNEHLAALVQVIPAP